MPIIRVQDLVKEFRRTKRQSGKFGALRTLVTRQTEVTRAVDGISFSIDEGELLGYIGANGAGKSTTIKILTGILVPSSGEVDVAGLVPWKSRERNALNMGVVFGQRSQLWWDLPLIESFKLVSRMYRVPETVYRRNLDLFTAMLAMGDFLQTPVRQLSLGQRMRGDLTAALLYEPPIIYLDEPTVGLDVLAKQRIRDFIARINRERATTVILTTHDLSDVERLCRRILLIDHGRVVYDGSVEQLKALSRPTGSSSRHWLWTACLDPIAPISWCPARSRSAGRAPDLAALRSSAGARGHTDRGSYSALRGNRPLYC